MDFLYERWSSHDEKCHYRFVNSGRPRVHPRSSDARARLRRRSNCNQVHRHPTRSHFCLLKMVTRATTGGDNMALGPPPDAVATNPFQMQRRSHLWRFITGVPLYQPHRATEPRRWNKKVDICGPLRLMKAALIATRGCSWV